MPDTRGKLVDILIRPDVGGDDRTCLVDGDRTYTVAQVRNEVARCAEQLRGHGVRAGDRVLALLDHDPRAAFFLAAASALGLRLMMPYGLRAAALPEWLAIQENARPDVVIHLKRDRTGVDALRARGARVVELGHPDTETTDGETTDGEAPDRELVVDHPEPIANFVVLFSSGTTGIPKAISIAEPLIVAKIASVTAALAVTPDARLFMSGLMNNTTGVIFTFGGVLRGATVIFPDDLDPAGWPAQVAAHRATHIQLRPVALKEFIAAAPGVDLSCLRVVAYGGGSVPRALLEQGRRMIPGDWVQGYGLSETYGPFCWLDEAAHRERRYQQVYCLGRPDDTVAVRLDPVPGHPDGVGEILVRGAVMEGYLDVATQRVLPPGEWFRTGDLGAWGPEGDLLLKGRVATSLLTGNGHRIYPEETEAALAGAPGADDVVLVGLPEPDTVVERPVVCLRGPIGDQPPDVVRKIVTDELAHRLSPEKWPDLAYATTAPFPQSANGKVMRAEVARHIERDGLIDLSPTALSPTAPSLTAASPTAPSSTAEGRH